MPSKYRENLKEVIKNLEKKKSFDGLRIELIDQENAGNIAPTFFDTNKFSEPFQEIIDTYGTPRYKEVNPGYFAIVWFPYMFGTMFGDAGHGLALLTFGLFILFKPKSFPLAI